MKYLDETGLAKLIELIKAKDTELENANNATDTKATKAQADATAAKSKAESIEANVSAMTAITSAEVESVWNGAVL